MPGFSKDTMRTTLCTIVFLFSLPWSLNGHLTTSYENIEVTNTEPKATGQKDHTIDPGKENVVSLSKSIQRLHLTSHSEKRSIRSGTPYSEDKVSNQRMKRTTWNGGHHLTTFLVQTKRQIKEEIKTRQRKGSHRPHTTYLLETENATELNVSTKTPSATDTNVLPEEKTTRGPSETLEAIQVSLSSAKRQHITGDSEQRPIHLGMPNGEDETSNQRTKRNTNDGEHNLLAQPESQTMQEEATRPQKEQQKPRRSSHRPHNTFPMQTQNATNLNIFTKTPSTTRADVSPEISSGPSEELAAIHSSISKSVQTQHFTSQSDQQGTYPGTVKGEEETPDQRTKRNIHDADRKPTESFHRLQTSKFYVLTKTPNATTADVLLEERTSRGALVTQEAKQVLLSNIQTQRVMSQSEQLRTMNREDETSNQRTKWNIHGAEHNLTTSLQIIQEEPSTPGNEQRELTESSQRQHTISPLENETGTEFNISTKPPNAIRADVLPIETTSRGLSETQETTQETPFTSSSTGLHGDNTNTTENIHSIQPTMETTDQPSSMTYAHTYSTNAATYFTVTVSTNGVKTTKKEVTVKWTSTQGLEPENASTTNPAKTSITTKKTTKEQRYPALKDKQQVNPGPAVAAVIGTTFFLMFIAIIVISVRKRKMQKRQLENPEWAGPSPFLDGDAQPNLPNMDESEAINRQAFNQMSISRYLSNRLSKHLTLSRNMSEEVLMGDILQGSTFGRQNPDEVQAPNGNSSATQDQTKTEVNKIQEGQASVDSSDTKPPASGQEPVMKSKELEQIDDLTPLPSSDTDTIIKPPPTLESIDLDSLSEDASPLQTSDGGIVPPAPPLP